MKITNVGLDNAYAIVRGWVSDIAAAASGLISVTDKTTGTTVAPVNSMVLVGQLLNDGGSGTLVVDIQAVLAEYTNNSAVDLVYGDVVVIDTTADIAVTTTTTAQDTRPIGIVLAPIGAGGTGPVQTAGVVQSINVSSSVTRGYYAETAAVATEATQNATLRAGSFGTYLEGGTTPTVLLFGYTANSGSGAGTFLTVIEGEGSTIKAHGNMGSTETFDPTDGNVHTGTLNANCTFTLNPPTDGSVACSLEFQLTEDGTGGWTVTWPGSVTVVGTLITTAGAINKVFVETLDGGSTWRAYVAGPGFTSPMTTRGDIIIENSTPTAARLAIGAAGKFLSSDGTDPSWGQGPATTDGDLIIGATAGTPTRLAVGAAGKLLSGGTTPAWGQGPLTTDGDLLLGATAGTPTRLASGALNTVLTGNGVGSAPSWQTPVTGSVEPVPVWNVTFNGDGAQTVFELPAAPYDPYSIGVYIGTGRNSDWVLSGTMLTTLTFGAAPTSGTNNVSIDIMAATI